MWIAINNKDYDPTLKKTAFTNFNISQANQRLCNTINSIIIKYFYPFEAISSIFQMKKLKKNLLKQKLPTTQNSEFRLMSYLRKQL